MTNIAKPVHMVEIPQPVERDFSDGITCTQPLKNGSSDLQLHAMCSHEVRSDALCKLAAAVAAKPRNFVRVHYDFTKFELWYSIVCRNKALNRLIKACPDEARRIHLEEWLPLVLRVNALVDSLTKDKQ